MAKPKKEIEHLEGILTSVKFKVLEASECPRQVTCKLLALLEDKNGTLHTTLLENKYVFPDSNEYLSIQQLNEELKPGIRISVDAEKTGPKHIPIYKVIGPYTILTKIREES